MLEDSVLRGTGQMWKFYASTLILVPGTAAFAIGLVGFILGFVSVHVAIIGAIAAAAAIAFAAFAIRCPSCGAHWYWLALRKLDRGWTGRLFDQGMCPNCQFRTTRHGA